MAEEDESRGVAAEGGGGDSEGADEWVAPELKGPQRRPGPNDAAIEEEIPPDPEEAGAASSAATGDSPTPATPEPIGFTFVANKFGPGTEGVYLNGEPLGVYVHRELGGLDGAQLEQHLIGMGLDEKRAATYGRRRGDTPEVELPPDIDRIWANDRATAMTMIDAWGLEAFRTSTLHLEAIQAAERDSRMEPIRKAFIEAQKKKEKKK